MREHSAVQTELHEHTLVIRFERPHSLNAFNLELGSALIDALEEAAAAPEVRAVVLTGSGRAFSAGADLKDLGIPTPDGRAPDLEHALTTVFNRPVRLLRDLAKPVIAALNGPAVGIAVSYALACDAIIAAPASYLLAPFASIGLVPDGGMSALVTARAGTGAFNQLCLLGRRLSAQEAHVLGLIDQLADDALSVALEIAAQMALMPPDTFGPIKKLINDGPLQGLEAALVREAQLQGVQARSPGFARALAAFRDK